MLGDWAALPRENPVALEKRLIGRVVIIDRQECYSPRGREWFILQCDVIRAFPDIPATPEDAVVYWTLVQ